MEIVNFTPLPAFIGGALIGLASALLMWANGRIAGVSGIAGGVIYPTKGDVDWRIVFIVGLVIGGLIYQAVGVGAGVAHIQAVASTPILVLAGLLVGIGSTIGMGCTSGHGICGLARRSGRSLVATLSFMITAFITVFVVRHIFGG